MKLIRCYIENFGGLQQYTVDFSDGLTVICEPNGFGKTTLAEFIRAMFYGFPRANKDLLKNPRQKYAPWQGGRYGGYLIFEHNNKQYRIDRSFGETPKGDKFKLYDEETHKESRDFTADIGNELFGLDGEAFLRSTYMPQMRDSGLLSTDSIRAKLGNLLEDTADMGSYEKALARLRDKRTAYEHFRGNGGSIHELNRRMTTLQTELSSCRSKQPALEQTAAEIAETHEALALGDAALQDIRKALSAATTAQAEAALSREYEGLVTRSSNSQSRLSALERRYPAGLPTAVETEAVSKAMDAAAALKGSLQETPADRSAAQTVAAQTDRFAKGIPPREAFAEQAQILESYTNACRDLQAAVLPEEESERLHKLDLQFRNGEPNAGWFADCRSMEAELSELETSRKGMHLSDEDQMRLQALGSFFAESVPEQTELEQHSRQLDSAEQLRRENLRLAAAMPSEAPAPEAPVKKFHSLFFPALIFGLLAAAAGVYLLTAQTILIPDQMLIGGISVAAAVVALIAACFLQISHSLTSKLQQTPAGGMTAAQRSLMEENEGEAARLEEETAAFVSRFPFEGEEGLRHRLSDIQTNRALYLPLRARAKQLEQAAAEADSRIAVLRDTLTERLTPYFMTIPAFDTALHLLEARLQQYHSLLERQGALQQRVDDLSDTVQRLEQLLLDFLQPYCPAVRPADFRKTLNELEHDADSFLRAKEHLQQRQTAIRQRDKQLQALAETVAAFAAKYNLHMGLDDRDSLKAVERDMNTAQPLREEAEQAAKALNAFLAEHGPKPASEVPEQLADPNALKLAEQDQIKRQNEHRSRIAQLEQTQHILRGELDRIPELTDELNRCTEQKAADTESRRLLDTTIEYLQKARESLSTSYLSGVQAHFARYLNRLTGEDAGHIALNTDLEVQLERAGSHRALTHFSAGQTDAVHLCMRLALSDALFEDSKCFMILDDPFVNLDDAHTAQALELLRELAKERQIIYLVCHSSRV